MSDINVPGGFDFSTDWFSAHTPTWDTVLPRFNPRKILEIGSFEGRSTCYLIQNFTKQRTLELHCVDTWQGGVEHGDVRMSDVERRFDNNVAVAQQGIVHLADVRKHKMFSHLALSQLIAAGHAGSFDVVYVDGSHQATDVLSDAVLSFHLLRQGGLMIFDDYLWAMEPLGHQQSFNMPKPAIDAFLNIFQRKMVVMAGTPLYQLYAVKKGG